MLPLMSSCKRPTRNSRRSRPTDPNTALAEALQQLEEAQAEEQQVRAALATAGEQNQHLRKLGAAALVVDHEGRAEAQSDVDRVAVEADLVGQQLADAQQESEIRLALGELDIRLQELAEDAPEYTVKPSPANWWRLNAPGSTRRRPHENRVRLGKQNVSELAKAEMGRNPAQRAWQRC